MNRNDWVFVGIRLYGMYLLVDALIIGLDAMRASSRTSGWLVAKLIVMLVVGGALFFGTRLINAWLEHKDDALARAEHAARTPSTQT